MVAINPASLEAHTAWAQKMRFDFPIAVDTDLKVARAYGVTNLLGIKRTVILVNKAGLVTWVKEGLPSTEEILAAIDALAQDDPGSSRLSSS